MLKDVYSAEVTQAIQSAQARGLFPSPADWRDCWIYFILLDRFNNSVAPNGTWNQRFNFRQGGTFAGVQEQLLYLQDLGVRAIWLSPVLKNSRPNFEYNYHGYGAQDFLNVDERFASDGTLATAEQELKQLVDAAHQLGMYVILDIVLNHTARVFDYVRGSQVVDSFADPSVMNAPLGQEPDIEWLNGSGKPQSEWKNTLPDAAKLSPDDAVWPTDLQRAAFFRRRGTKLTDDPWTLGFVRGDFGDMRQLVMEYDARPASELALRQRYGVTPVQAILIRAYTYLIAQYDFDGFRIDTVKYVQPQAIQTFGNAMREFGLSVGKKNFFTFGEIYDNEENISKFVGRQSPAGEGFGIDAALDFPLFYILPAVAKAQAGVEAIRKVYDDRKRDEQGQLSSHGEAGRYFVSFLDNHDQHQRVQHPQTPHAQVDLSIALLFTLQGIPSLYYGTEQGLSGTVDAAGNADLNANESTREALWGKTPVAFDRANRRYQLIQKLATLRSSEPPLLYGRLYFREVSGNGTDFGLSNGAGGIVAFSRVLVDREVVVVANSNSVQGFSGWVVVDRDLNFTPRKMRMRFSNLGHTGSAETEARANGSIAALAVKLEKSEVQVWAPE